MPNKQSRRVAAHEVHISGKVLHQAVVVIVGGKVIDCYEFIDEEPMTEWLGGTIEVRGGVAYWKNKRLQ